MVDDEQLRRLGKTDIMVSPIGLGVMELSGGGGLIGNMFPTLSVEDKNAIIKAALDGGINFFDTAEMYGLGVSESALACGLKAASVADKDVVIATKWLPLMRTAGNIAKTIDDRLRYLDGYTISNYMIHQPWSFSTPEAEMDAMADLVEAGKIKSVGVSNFNPERMRRAHDALAKRGIPLVLNQMRYSLIHREIETDGTLAAAKDLGITIVAYTPLASGILTGKYHQNPELIQHKNLYYKGTLKRELDQTRILIKIMSDIAENHNATLAQVALNWVINFNGDCVVTIPGATKVHQAQESAGAMNFTLSEDELIRLDEASRQLN